MPAAAPDHEPRPRLAAWLLAGAFVVAVAAGLAAAAWRWLPGIAPVWVAKHCPWPAPVIRAARAWDRLHLFRGDSLIAGWVKRGEGRYDALLPYLSSMDDRTRGIVVRGFARLTEIPHSPAVEQALLLLLRDKDENVRAAATQALTDPASIPALEACLGDPVDMVRDHVEEELERLRGLRAHSHPTPSPVR